jgi:HNH endonuclease
MTSARDLTARLADLLRRERAALAELLVALAEFDRERRWLELGHASLFYFLHRELGLSKGAAFYRKTAAELIQRFPEVVEPLRDGRLCLTSVVELAKVISPENQAEVLPRFFQLSKREAKELSATIRPAEAAPHRAVVTPLSIPAALSGPALPSRVQRKLELGRAEPVGGRSGSPDEPIARNQDEGADAAISPQVVAPPARSPAAGRRDEAEPLTADLSRLHVTVSRRFLEKLEAARAALSHSHPGASTQEILEAGLDLLLERHAKRRGRVEKPRRDPPPATPEHVPSHVKRAVWERDGGRCQWELEGGGICGSTHRVELDHVVPRGRGGPSTVENCRLLCRVHNDLSARLVYGDAWMDRFKRLRGPPTRPTTRPHPRP